MQGPALHIEKVGTDNDIIKLKINSDIHVKTAIPQLAKAILNCFQNGNFKIILDLEQIKFPSASFIAFLIEMTSEARRENGDIKLINIAMSAKNNIATFNPLNYLSMDMEEAYALEDFGALAPHKKPISRKGEIDDFVNQSHSEAESDTQPPEPVQIDEVTQSIPSPIGLANEESVSEPDTSSEAGKAKQPPFPRSKSPVAREHADVVARPESPPRMSKKISNLNEVPAANDVKIIRNDKSKEYRIRVKSKNASLYTICDFVTALANQSGIAEREVGKIKVTVYEACLNVIEHAYHSDPDEWIVVTVQIRKSAFFIIIQDWGESFKFDNSSSYNVEQAMQDRRTGGFGLYIIRRSMDDVFYKTDPVNGNRLILKKNI